MVVGFLLLATTKRLTKIRHILLAILYCAYLVNYSYQINYLGWGDDGLLKLRLSQPATELELGLG